MDWVNILNCEKKDILTICIKILYFFRPSGFLLLKLGLSMILWYQLCSIVVECLLWVREVLGSNLPRAESYQRLVRKMVLTAPLCNTPHKEIEQGGYSLSNGCTH